jgi:hypothetical protein
VVGAGAGLAWQSMNNREIQAAWKYHDGSKHSYWSIRNHPHSLDWANRAVAFQNLPKDRASSTAAGGAANRGGPAVRNLRTGAFVAG